jgi:hypothetical protein
MKKHQKNSCRLSLSVYLHGSLLGGLGIERRKGGEKSGCFLKKVVAVGKRSGRV